MWTEESACQYDASSAVYMIFEIETLKKKHFCHSQVNKNLKTVFSFKNKQKKCSVLPAQFPLSLLSFCKSGCRDMQKHTFASICVWYCSKDLCFHVSFSTNTQIALETPKTEPKLQGVKLVPHKGYLTVRFLDMINPRFQGPTWCRVIPGR